MGRLNERLLVYHYRIYYLHDSNTSDRNLYRDIMKEDAITYLEMARIAMATVPDTIVEEMDMSDDEFVRLRDQLQQYMDN